MTQFFAFQTGEKFNPATREGTYSEPDRQTVFVVSTGKGPAKVVTSYGDGGVQVGDTVSVAWQYAMANDRYGVVKVVGKVDPDGTQTGEVPNRALAHFVMK